MDELRNKALGVRVTTSEHGAIKNFTHDQRKTISNYVRDLILADMAAATAKEVKANEK